MAIPIPHHATKNNTILAIHLSLLTSLSSLTEPIQNQIITIKIHSLPSSSSTSSRTNKTTRERELECSGISETISMMEMAQVGVRTRARALALAAAAAAAATGTARKRKVNNRELVLSTSYIELRSTSRRRVIITPENSVSVPLPPEINPGHRTVIQDRCSSPSTHHASASCCSSNGSSDQRINKFADLEAESVEVETSVYYSCRERRETTPSSQLRAESSDELDSTARPSSAANSRRRSTGVKMPTESELDDFFSEAEKNIKKQFAEKYNYDIAKDEPLEGRYEWVRLKQ